MNPDDEDDNDGFEEEEAMHIDDDDGGVESDGDVCDTCECPRDHHEGGAGPCSCGRCRKFREP